MKIDTLNKAKWIILILALIVLFCAVQIQSCTTQQETARIESSSDDFEEKNGPISWPTLGPATVLPKPEELTGRINWDRSDSFAVYIDPTTAEQYKSYVDACIEKGFTIDYSRSGNRYSASNAERYSLTVSYTASSEEMYISISAPKDQPAEAATPAEPTTEPVPQATTGASASFKEIMDSYEKFFDDYIAFMQKYNSSGDPVSMLGDYTRFMAQYADTMKKLDDIDENSLTSEDRSYYLEVMNRINQKLADAALAK